MKYGRLIILQEIGSPKVYNGKPNHNFLVLARCDCGVEKVMSRHQILHGQSVSCGCSIKERSRAGLYKTHGMTKTPEYEAYRAMFKRCYNPNHKQYFAYGARGIKVCAAWHRGFEVFYRDMGPRPSARHSLERKNNHGNYSPNNCKWETMHVQSRNKRNNRFFTVNGESMILVDWALRYGLKKATVASRIRQGMTMEEALTLPLRRGHRDKTFAARLTTEA